MLAFGAPSSASCANDRERAETAATVPLMSNNDHDVQCGPDGYANAYNGYPINVDELPERLRDEQLLAVLNSWVIPEGMYIPVGGQLAPPGTPMFAAVCAYLNVPVPYLARGVVDVQGGLDSHDVQDDPAVVDVQDGHGVVDVSNRGPIYCSDADSSRWYYRRDDGWRYYSEYHNGAISEGSVDSDEDYECDEDDYESDEDDASVEARSDEQIATFIRTCVVPEGVEYYLGGQLVPPGTLIFDAVCAFINGPAEVDVQDGLAEVDVQDGLAEVDVPLVPLSREQVVAFRAYDGYNSDEPEDYENDSDYDPEAYAADFARTYAGFNALRTSVVRRAPSTMLLLSDESDVSDEDYEDDYESDEDDAPFVPMSREQVEVFRAFHTSVVPEGVEYYLNFRRVLPGMPLLPDDEDDEYESDDYESDEDMATPAFTPVPSVW